MLDLSSETSIVSATLGLLACFSLITWSVILLKLGEWGLSVYRNFRFKKSVWDTAGQSLRKQLDIGKAQSQFARIYQAAEKVMAQIPSQPALRSEQYTPWHELLERTLQQQVQKEKSTMDSGLGLLASFGSTSPFVGLFGTVWGIMDALKDISSKGSASLEVVAGPIGEALIATAIGIAVAIPAVLAYNFFIRLNRGTTAKMEHFANDYLQVIIQGHLTQQTVTTHGNSNAK
jgi:biopolymer transport protein ExbB